MGEFLIGILTTVFQIAMAQPIEGGYGLVVGARFLRVALVVFFYFEDKLSGSG